MSALQPRRGQVWRRANPQHAQQVADPQTGRMRPVYGVLVKKGEGGTVFYVEYDPKQKTPPRAGWKMPLDLFLQNYEFVEDRPSGKRIAKRVVQRQAAPVDLSTEGWEAQHPALVETIQQANATLKKAQIVEAQLASAAQEADGYDVIYQLGNLNKNATLTLDFAGQQGQEKHLQEIVFALQCAKLEPFVASADPLITHLLGAVAVLQASEARSPVPKVPPEKAKQEGIKAWVEDRIVNMQGRAVQVEGKDIAWTDLAAVKAAIKSDQGMEPADKQALLAYLAAGFIISAWPTIVKQAEARAQVGGTTMTRDSIDALLQPLVQHELAKGVSIKGNYQITKYQNGNLLLQMNAAYPMYAAVKRQGNAVSLVEMGLQLCEISYAVTTPAAAKQLVSAMVTLAKARKNTAVPSNSKEPEQTATPKLDFSSMTVDDLLQLMHSGVIVGYQKDPNTKETYVVVTAASEYVLREKLPMAEDSRRPTQEEKDEQEQVNNEINAQVLQQVKQLGLTYYFRQRALARPTETESSRVDIMSVTGDVLFTFNR